MHGVWSMTNRRNSTGIRAEQLTQNNRSSYFNPISPATPSSQLTTPLSSTPIYHFQRASKSCLSFVKLRFTWLNMPSWLIPRHFVPRLFVPRLFVSLLWFTPCRYAMFHRFFVLTFVSYIIDAIMSIDVISNAYLCRNHLEDSLSRLSCVCAYKYTCVTHAHGCKHVQHFIRRRSYPYQPSETGYTERGPLVARHCIRIFVCTYQATPNKSTV